MCGCGCVWVRGCVGREGGGRRVEVGEVRVCVCVCVFGVGVGFSVSVGDGFNVAFCYTGVGSK